MRLRGPYALSVTAFGALGVVLLWPLASLFLRGLESGAGASVFSDPFFRHVVAFTLTQAFLSAACAGVVGTVGAVLWSDHEFAGRAWLWRLSRLCFAVPSILVVLAFLGLWGREGVVNRVSGWAGLGRLIPDLYGWPALLAANTFFNFPLFLTGVGRALRELDRDPERVALSLGASRWRCFRSVTLPRVWPELRSALVLAFLYSSAASFLVVLLLGGGPRFTTIEVAVYQAIKVDFDPALAARLAAVQIAIAAALYALLLFRPADGAAPAGGVFTPIFRFAGRGANRAALAGYLAFVGVLAAAPLMSLALSGLAALPALSWEELAAPVWGSVRLAVGAACGSLALAAPLAYLERHAASPAVRIAVGALAGLPLSLSALVVLLALALAYPETLGAWRGSLVAIGVVQSVMALPAVYRPVRDAFFRVPDALVDSAASLGASPWAVLGRVEWPLLVPSLAGAALLGAAYSLGEVGSVMLFAGEGVTTLPLALYRLLGQYRFSEAHAAGLVLLVTLVGLQAVAARWER